MEKRLTLDAVDPGAVSVDTVGALQLVLEKVEVVVHEAPLDIGIDFEMLLVQVLEVVPVHA